MNFPWTFRMKVFRTDFQFLPSFTFKVLFKVTFFIFMRSREFYFTQVELSVFQKFCQFLTNFLKLKLFCAFRDTSRASLEISTQRAKTVPLFGLETPYQRLGKVDTATDVTLPIPGKFSNFWEYAGLFFYVLFCRLTLHVHVFLAFSRLFTFYSVSET